MKSAKGVFSEKIAEVWRKCQIYLLIKLEYRKILKLELRYFYPATLLKIQIKATEETNSISAFVRAASNKAHS